ncbi:helix-turn-helix transcriptional regulator [uncultured Slackia sp.]|uniref:helix-turn-helix domain-containing protein n=1 Tax=uncultured Slackia sp. TaxID=665903 RepID=UPI0025D3B128|nr:helix-turn-helix transcriptional regulator [uncultured Slackia sp.]
MATLVAKARQSSLKTQEDFAAMMGTTATTLCKWENNPDEWFTPIKLKKYYEAVGADGKQYLKDYVSSFFE